MYLFYTSQETSVIDVFSCQPFDSLKDGTKSIAEGDKLRKSCQAIKLLCLKKRNYQSLACFWILIEFNGILGLEKVGERKWKEKKIYKKSSKKEQNCFMLMDWPIILPCGSLTDALYTVLSIWCTGILYSQIFQWIIHIFFSEKPTFLWSLALTILLSILDSIIKTDALHSLFFFILRNWFSSYLY